MVKEKEINYDESNFDLMPEKKQNLILKKLEKAILKAKQTPQGRCRLAKAFGGTQAKYKL